MSITANISGEQELLTSLKEENYRLTRMVERLERTVRRDRNSLETMNIMYENSLVLRDFDTREKEKQYLYNRLLIQAFPTPLIVFDAELKYAIGTAALLEKFSGRPCDPVGKTLEELFCGVDKRWVKKTFENLKKVLREKIELKYNDYLTFADSSGIYVSINIAPASDVDGLLHGVVFLLQDITEPIAISEKARTSAQAKTTFLTSMSHEIRTPMNAIIGMGNLLRSTELGEVQKKYLENMLRASSNLLDIINDILDFSKIESGRFEIVEREYSIPELVGDVVNIIRLRAAEKGLAFTLDISPNLYTRYFGDSMRIKQIIINILTNAVKYTNEGSVIFKVSPCREGDVCGIKFSVKDTGIGIRPEDREALFMPFSQLDIKKNHGIEGTGLGLVISKNLATAMHGDISVDSVYGKGSLFTFSVPQKNVSTRFISQIDRPEDKKVVICAPPARAKVLASKCLRLYVKTQRIDDPALLRKKTENGEVTHILFDYNTHTEFVRGLSENAEGICLIAVKDFETYDDLESHTNYTYLLEPMTSDTLAHALNQQPRSDSEEYESFEDTSINNFKVKNTKFLIVDDNKINLLVAKEILELFGAHIDTALCGTDAIELVKQTDYDIIFMDHMMPDPDGIETTRLIRELGTPYCDLPIIALSANTIGDMEEFFVKNRMDDYLSKPLDIELLNQKLLKWLPKEKFE